MPRPRCRPGPHNAKFLPDPGPIMATGVKAMTAAATAPLQPEAGP